MKIEYLNDISEINALQLKGFFVDWPNPPSQNTHFKILNQSTYFWVAIDIDSKQVVGFINAISDKVLSAYIPLLEVLPKYKNQGIGSRLVELMLKTLSDIYMVDIVCDENLVAFYKAHNFINGNAMMLRHYERQSGK